MREVTDEMLQDYKRLKNAQNDVPDTDKVYEVDFYEMNALKGAYDALRGFFQTAEKKPLKVPFTSLRSKEAAFERSVMFPHEFYKFQCFQTVITIWRESGNEKKYAVATFGYMPSSSYFVYHRGYNGKYMYFNLTEDFEKCVADFYMLVGEFMVKMLGLNLQRTKNGAQLTFEPLLIDEEFKVSVKNGVL